MLPTHHIVINSAKAFKVTEIQVMHWINKAVNNSLSVGIFLERVADQISITSYGRPKYPITYMVSQRDVKKFLTNNIPQSSSVILLIDLIGKRVFINSDRLNQEFEKENIDFWVVREKNNWMSLINQIDQEGYPVQKTQQKRSQCTIL